MKELARKECVLSNGETMPLPEEQVSTLLARLEGWQRVKGYRLHKRFLFTDFSTALAFVNRVGKMADEQNHHPEIHLSWGQVDIEIWTHTIEGLVLSDFIFAAKTSALDT